MGETAVRFLPWPGGGAVHAPTASRRVPSRGMSRGTTFLNNSSAFVRAKRLLRPEEEEQANIEALPLRGEAEQ